MSKNWYEVINNTADDTSTLKIYGPIDTESPPEEWNWDGTVSHVDFAKTLTDCNGKDLIIRINSGGGSVMAAHAIYNMLKDYPGNKTVIIDGLAASAATIVAMAGDHIIMPSNALFMIHNPMVVITAAMDKLELDKLSSQLGSFKKSIVNLYCQRTKLSAEEISQLMDEESWLTPEDALEYGFIDEIKGTVADFAMQGNMLVVNSVKHDLTGYKNVKNLVKNKTPKKEEPKPMNEQLLEILNKMKEIVTGKSSEQAQEVKNEVPDLEAIKNEAIQQERDRVNNLDALLVEDNVAVKAVIEKAKQQGKTAKDVKDYVEALKVIDFTTPGQKLQNKAEIDALNSGAGDVAPNVEDSSTEMDTFVNILNNKLGGKK